MGVGYVISAQRHASWRSLPVSLPPLKECFTGNAGEFFAHAVTVADSDGAAARVFVGCVLAALLHEFNIVDAAGESHASTLQDRRQRRQ